MKTAEYFSTSANKENLAPNAIAAPNRVEPVIQQQTNNTYHNCSITINMAPLSTPVALKRSLDEVPVNDLIQAAGEQLAMLTSPKEPPRKVQPPKVPEPMSLRKKQRR